MAVDMVAVAQRLEKLVQADGMCSLDRPEKRRAAKRGDRPSVGNDAEPDLAVDCDIAPCDRTATVRINAALLKPPMRPPNLGTGASNRALRPPLVELAAPAMARRAPPPAPPPPAAPLAAPPEVSQPAPSLPPPMAPPIGLAPGLSDLEGSCIAFGAPPGLPAPGSLPWHCDTLKPPGLPPLPFQSEVAAAMAASQRGADLQLLQLLWTMQADPSLPNASGHEISPDLNAVRGTLERMELQREESLKRISQLAQLSAHIHGQTPRSVGPMADSPAAVGLAGRLGSLASAQAFGTPGVWPAPAAGAWNGISNSLCQTPSMMTAPGMKLELSTPMSTCTPLSPISPKRVAWQTQANVLNAQSLGAQALNAQAFDAQGFSAQAQTAALAHSICDACLAQEAQDGKAFSEVASMGFPTAAPEPCTPSTREGDSSPERACSMLASGQCSPERRAHDQTMRAHLRSLQSTDHRRVLKVRKIQPLGFDAEELLKAHFQEYGPVESVLVAHVRRCSLRHHAIRQRPAHLGFVVMQTLEGAEAALGSGLAQTVAGATLQVDHFQQTENEEYED